MKRSDLARLSPASPSQLLVDFVCSPVAMRADRLFAICNHLGLGLQASTDETARSRFELLVKQAMQGDEEEFVAPWEEPIYDVQDGVALVHVAGPLLKGYDAFTCWWYGYFCMDRLQAALAELAARADVVVVVFLFNSPGGVCTGIHETAQQIAELGLSKLTVAFTETMCCSAAYWLACACHAISASVSSDVGSIGVYMALYDYAGYLKMWGIKLDLIRCGRLKGIGVMGKSLTAEEIAFLKADCARVDARFHAAVLGGRGKVEDDTMQGQWFDGEEAQARNLIDAVVPSPAALLANIRAMAV